MSIRHFIERSSKGMIARGWYEALSAPLRLIRQRVHSHHRYVPAILAQEGLMRCQLCVVSNTLWLVD
jgi:hypothetical protein